MMPFETRTLCEWVPAGILSSARPLGFFGSRTSTIDVPNGLAIWPIYAMPLSTTIWPPPAQSNQPTSRTPFAELIVTYLFRCRLRAGGTTKATSHLHLRAHARDRLARLGQQLGHIDGGEPRPLLEDTAVDHHQFDIR